MLQKLYESIPGSVDFSGEVVGSIMRSAVVTPRFDEYAQALTMAQSAVTETLSSGEILLSRLQTARREINIFLSRS